MKYWKLIILLLLLLLLLLSVGIWGIYGSKYCVASRNRIVKEGLDSSSSNKSYIYYPNVKQPDLNKKVKINYLINETIEAVGFLKKKKNLIHVPPPPPEELKIPPKPDPYVDDVGPIENTENYTNMTSEFGTEYSKDYKKIELYQKYQTFVSEINERMEKDFGEVFISENLTSPNANKLLEELTQSLEEYDSAYNYTKYFVIQPLNGRKYVKNQWIQYYITLIKKHSNNQDTLNQIKTELFKLLKPTYLFGKLCRFYKENISIYGTKDDALIILNLAIITIKDLDYSKIKNKNGVVYSIEEDNEDKNNSVLILDAFKYSDIAFIVYQIMLFVAFNINPHFGIQFEFFVNEYGKHMEEKKINSFYTFMLKYPPQLPKM